jgi:hypothetical protein
MIFERGPDVHFQLTTLQVEGQDFIVIVASEFFNEQLTIYYSADGSDTFLSDSTKVENSLIIYISVFVNAFLKIHHYSIPTV